MRALASAPGTRHVLGAAFGLCVESESPIPGLRPLDAGSREPRVRLQISVPRVLPEAPAPVMAQRAANGRLLASLEQLEGGDHRMFAAGFGCYDVSADGGQITCHPAPGATEWVWQRFLLGQAMPFAAALNGIEPFHASAVVMDDEVVAIAGRSGSGKSSIALELASRGLPFFTDDVVGITRAGTCVAGAEVANIRDRSLRERAERGRYPFGPVLGRSEASLRVFVHAEPHPRPMRAVYYLDRRARSPVRQFRADGDPFMLLAHTFNRLVQTPQRLERQLDACARLAAVARQVHVRAPDWLPAGELAALIALHADERVRAR